MTEDVTRDRLDELRFIPNRPGSKIVTTYSRKRAGTDMTATERAVYARIPETGLAIGFYSKPLAYAPAVFQFSIGERKALLSLLDRGVLRIDREYAPDRESIMLNR